MAARTDFICTYGRERADRRPVDDPLRSHVPAQTPRSDAPEQRPRPDLDPDQIDAAVDSGQIDVAGTHQLRAVLVDDLAIEHVVRKGDVRRTALDGPRICRGGAQANRRRRGSLDPAGTDQHIAPAGAHDDRRGGWIRRRAASNEPPRPQDARRARPAESLTSVPRTAASEISEPWSACAAALSRQRRARCSRSWATASKRAAAAGSRSFPGNHVGRMNPIPSAYPGAVDLPRPLVHPGHTDSCLRGDDARPRLRRECGTCESGDGGRPTPSTATGMGGSDLREAIFGSFDGMTSTLGVVAGLLATNATAPKILAAAIGIAVAATVGMGAGQYLSDGARNMRRAVVMAVATLIGSVLPAIPFVFGDSRACVARVDRHHRPRRRDHRSLPGIPGHVLDLDRRLRRHGRPVYRRGVERGRDHGCSREARARSLVSSRATSPAAIRARVSPGCSPAGRRASRHSVGIWLPDHFEIGPPACAGRRWAV